MQMMNIRSEDIKLHDSPETLLPLVCEQMGYSPESISEQVHSKIINIIDKGLAAMQPDFIIRTTPINACGDGRIEAEAVVIESRKWANLLKKMDSPEVLCCFIITLGKQIDIISESLQEENLFDPFVMDAFGSVMVEKAADQMEAVIGSQLKKNNYECSRRFSPGYCDWELQSGQDSFCFLGHQGCVFRIPVRFADF